MSSQLGSVNIGGYPYSLGLEPDFCPYCRHACLPKQICFTDNSANNTFDYAADVAYQCPRHDCRRMFVARFRVPETHVEDIYENAKLALVDVVPRPVRVTRFPVEISSVSPRFVAIFEQAERSEALGMEDVAGPGLRKALEHLIKDYACSKSLGDIAKIKQTPLGQCVKQYLPDQRINQCAERAVWLGNDETHYERKWAGSDLSDLKRLITLTVNWIHNEALTDAYVSKMPEGKR